MHPQWISKAQKQIDDIVGHDRLPTFADRPKLPYVLAIIRGRCVRYMALFQLIWVFIDSETLRWRPSLRYGVAHQSTEDDVVEYNGANYFIPAGATIFPVTWWVYGSLSFLDSVIQWCSIGQLNMILLYMQTPTTLIQSDSSTTKVSCAQIMKQVYLVSAGDVRHDYLPLREPRFLISVPSVPRCLVCRTNTLDRDS